MGGLNVLVAGLSYPTKFEKIAALCPGVYTLSPFSAFSSMRDAAARTGANPKIAFGIWLLARRYVADETEWNQFSPIELIKRATNDYPDLYLSNGIFDSYGNFEGSSRLVDLARERGVATQWRPLYGGHCSIDIASLAEFLVSH